MSCGNIGNIRIEPVNITWAIEEQTHVTTVADVASSLNNKYFLLNDGENDGFYVWFNVAAAGVDPAPAGRTGIVVAIAANASAATVASAMQVAVDANAEFVASVSSNVVTITNADAGDADDTVDFNTGFTFAQCQEGGSLDLGLTDGDLEAAFEETLLAVTAHQTGVTPLADLRQGVVSEVTLTMKECDAAKLKQVFAKAAGGTYTPSGGTELFGWGTSRQGLSTIVQARRLQLHPVALASSNHTRDLCFWKAYPMPDTLVFSGENPQTLGLTFKVYLDDSKPAAIKQWVYGDFTQLVPVVP